MKRAADGFHGLQLALNQTAGARSVWVVHPGAQRIAPHRHDFACLTIPVIGSLTEVGEFGEADLAGPSVIYHPAGVEHEDRIGDDGLETVSIILDPHWLRFLGVTDAPARSRFWSGGPTALAARRLAKAWRGLDADEAALSAATATFFAVARSGSDALKANAPSKGQPAAAGSGAAGPARGRCLHPAWIARSYRAAAGEGLREALRRSRVEAAVRQLRESSAPLAEIAVAAGFCDQSHMNRSFRRVVGRTPLEVRREAALLGPVARANPGRSRSRASIAGAG